MKQTKNKKENFKCVNDVSVFFCFLNFTTYLALENFCFPCFFRKYVKKSDLKKLSMY